MAAGPYIWRGGVAMVAAVSLDVFMVWLLSAAGLIPPLGVAAAMGVAIAMICLMLAFAGGAD